MSSQLQKLIHGKPNQKRDLKCEKFDLIKRVSYWLLALLWVSVLGGFYFVATHITDDTVKGVLIGGGVGGVVKLVMTLYKALHKFLDDG